MAATPDIPDTPADPETITTAAAALDRTAAAITGHGDDIYGAINTAAFQFSDIVAGPIKNFANGHLKEWQNAVQAVTYGSGVTKLWAQDVQSFKTERDKLVSEWQSALDGRFGVHDPYVPGGATDQQAKEIINSYNTSLANAQNAKAGDITTRAHRLLDLLRANANARAGQVERDPTEADLLQLSRAGVLSWAAYVAFDKQNDPAIIPPVTGGDAYDAAKVLKRAANGENVDPNELRKALDLLNHVNSGVTAAIAAGATISVGALAYLYNLYSGLGSDLFKLPGALDKAGLGDYKRSLGTGLLLLSNENTKTNDPTYSGGFKQLPPEVQSLLTENPDEVRTDVPQFDGGVTTFIHSIHREADWQGLAALLGATNRHDGDPASYTPPVGGKEFSTDLTSQVAKIIQAENAGHAPKDPADGTRYATEGLLGDHGRTSDVLQSLLGASTRNHESDHDILVGKDGATQVKAIFGYEWNDDGKTAGELVNWIAKDASDAHAAGRENAQANEAAAALINITTADVDGKDPQSDFNAYYDGLKKNPAIADSLGGIAASYLHDFGSTTPGTDTTVAADGSVDISQVDRQRFLQLIASNSGAADRLDLVAGAYESSLRQHAGQPGGLKLETAGDIISNLDAQLSDARINAALHDSNNDRQAATTAYERHKFYADQGKEWLKAATGVVPIVGPGLSASTEGIWTSLQNKALPAPPEAYTPLLSDTQIHNATNRRDVGYNDFDTAYDFLETPAAKHLGPIPPELTTVDQHGNVVLKPQGEITSERDRLLLQDYVNGDPDFERYRNHDKPQDESHPNGGN